MDFRVVECDFERIRVLRSEHLKEMHCQVVRDALHRRPGWAQWYVSEVNGAPVGYIAVAMGGAWSGARTVFEYYLRPELRRSVHEVFIALIESASVRDIVLQTNDRLLTAVASSGIAELREVSILFSDGGATRLTAPQLKLGLTNDFPESSLFKHKVEPVGEYALLDDRTVIATGGILTHYNRPYGDIHMEVREDRRRCGYGSFFVQELKRIAFERGHEPCARCDVGNIASLRALTKAGMQECGRILEGKLSR